MKMKFYKYELIWKTHLPFHLQGFCGVLENLNWRKTCSSRCRSYDWSFRTPSEPGRCSFFSLSIVWFQVDLYSIINLKHKALGCPFWTKSASFWKLIKRGELSTKMYRKMVVKMPTPQLLIRSTILTKEFRKNFPHGPTHPLTMFFILVTF